MSILQMLHIHVKVEYYFFSPLGNLLAVVELPFCLLCTVWAGLLLWGGCSIDPACHWSKGPIALPPLQMSAIMQIWGITRRKGHGARWHLGTVSLEEKDRSNAQLNWAFLCAQVQSVSQQGSIHWEMGPGLGAQGVGGRLQSITADLCDVQPWIWEGFWRESTLESYALCMSLGRGL